jgi:hypothetical protein
MSNSFGDMAWFFRVERTRLTFADSTKTAMARADVPAQHERCGAIGPTLKNVWATRLLAYCVKIQTFDQLEHVVLVRGVTQSNLEPLGFGLTGFRIVADYSKFSGQSSGSPQSSGLGEVF